MKVESPFCMISDMICDTRRTSTFLSSKSSILYKKISSLVKLMLTNLVDGSDAESVTVAVLQWLNPHLQMIGEDEGDEKK